MILCNYTCADIIASIIGTNVIPYDIVQQNNTELYVKIGKWCKITSRSLSDLFEKKRGMEERGGGGEIGSC